MIRKVFEEEIRPEGIPIPAELKGAFRTGAMVIIRGDENMIAVTPKVIDPVNDMKGMARLNFKSVELLLEESRTFRAEEMLEGLK